MNRRRRLLDYLPPTSIPARSYSESQLPPTRRSSSQIPVSFSERLHCSYCRDAPWMPPVLHDTALRRTLQSLDFSSIEAALQGFANALQGVSQDILP